MVETLEHILRKHSLNIEDLVNVPAIAFVDELDLDDNDKREISNPAKEGWVIAYIDSLKKNQRNELDILFKKYLRTINLGHYNNIQMPWIARSEELYSLSKGRADVVEILEAYTSENSKRYRIAYPLLYPEMQELNLENEISKEKLQKMQIYFTKAEEVARENFNKHGPKGLNDYQRVKWAEVNRSGPNELPHFGYVHLIPKQQ